MMSKSNDYMGMQERMRQYHTASLMSQQNPALQMGLYQIDGKMYQQHMPVEPTTQGLLDHPSYSRYGLPMFMPPTAQDEMQPAIGMKRNGS